MARRLDGLFGLGLFRDAFEGSPVLLHVHEAAGVGVALHPLIGFRVVCLGAFADGAITVIVAFGGLVAILTVPFLNYIPKLYASILT